MIVAHKYSKQGHCNVIIGYNYSLSNTDIRLIGYKDSTYVADTRYQISTDTQIQSVKSFDVIEPSEFLSIDPKEFTNTAFIVCVFKDLSERRQIVDYIKKHNLKKFSFIHESSSLNIKEITIKPGSIVMQYCIVAHRAEIGEDCLVAPYTLISHKVTLGNNVNVCPATVINGSTAIGDWTYVGSRSTFKDGVSVPANTYLGMLSTVNKTLEESGTYLGNPVRRLNDQTVFDHFNFNSAAPADQV